MSVAGPTHRFDPGVVVGHPDARRVLGVLASRLRAVGYRNRVPHGPPEEVAAARLALGLPTRITDVEGWLGSDGVAALVETHVFRSDADSIVSEVLFLMVGPTLVVVPADDRGEPDAVYFGRDTTWFLELLFRLAPGGDRALDLGTGTGAAAALLTTRYRTVIASDLVPRSAACAALTLACNAGLGTAASVVADAARGFRTDAFDLVTGNIPWVPGARHPDGSAVVFADAGADGKELPRRFLLEGAALLRPGGLLVMYALDAVCAHGQRPLRQVRDALEAEGCSVVVVDTPADRCWPTLRTGMVQRGFHRARHVAVVVRRPRHRR